MATSQLDIRIVEVANGATGATGATGAMETSLDRGFRTDRGEQTTVVGMKDNGRNHRSILRFCGNAE